MTDIVSGTPLSIEQAIHTIEANIARPDDTPAQRQNMRLTLRRVLRSLEAWSYDDGYAACLKDAMDTQAWSQEHPSGPFPVAPSGIDTS